MAVRVKAEHREERGSAQTTELYPGCVKEKSEGVSVKNLFKKSIMMSRLGLLVSNLALLLLNLKWI